MILTIKYVFSLFLIIFGIIFLYQNNIILVEFQKKCLAKKKLYPKVKKHITIGMKMDDVEVFLKNNNISYIVNKNKNIDILGEGITIKIDKEETVIDFSPYNCLW
jgi:hypothetical protein